MNAGQVIELAKEWVEGCASQMPGFNGAHLVGRLNFTPKDAPFPAFMDADMNLVFQGTHEFDVHDLPYKGRILEYGSDSIDSYRSPEAVLTDPGLACNLAQNGILSDPTGMLASLHTVVVNEYPRRKWVMARCEAEKKGVLEALEELGRTDSPGAAFLHVCNVVINLSGLVASASLKPPAHRRCLALMKELLKTWGRSDLHEEALHVIGYANLQETQVESYLRDCSIAFDRAVEVTRTPVPFGFKLHAFVKPYVVDGVQEMLDEGCHREAMFWAGAFLWISNNAIQADAPEEEKLQFQLIMNRLYSDMGISTPQDVAVHFQYTRSLTEKVFKFADDIVSRNPEVIN
jgi:hypothetical protein